MRSERIQQTNIKCGTSFSTFLIFYFYLFFQAAKKQTHE